jgi:hypothetical protein
VTYCMKPGYPTGGHSNFLWLLHYFSVFSHIVVDRNYAVS